MDIITRRRMERCVLSCNYRVAIREARFISKKRRRVLAAETTGQIAGKALYQAQRPRKRPPTKGDDNRGTNEEQRTRKNARRGGKLAAAGHRSGVMHM